MISAVEFANESRHFGDIVINYHSLL